MAAAPTLDNDAREAPEAEPPQEDGRLPTAEEVEVQIMDAWNIELHGKGTTGGNSTRGPLHCVHADDHRQQRAGTAGGTAGAPAYMRLSMRLRYHGDTSCPIVFHGRR
eukprot:8180050-Pyramimonas_sp.AAC.1